MVFSFIPPDCPRGQFLFYIAFAVSIPLWWYIIFFNLVAFGKPGSKTSVIPSIITSVKTFSETSVITSLIGLFYILFGILSTTHN